MLKYPVTVTRSSVECRLRRGQRGIAVDGVQCPVIMTRPWNAEPSESSTGMIVVDAHVPGHPPRGSWERERRAELDQRAVAEDVQVPGDRVQQQERGVHRRQCRVVADLHVPGDEHQLWDQPATEVKSVFLGLVGETGVTCHRDQV